MVNLDKLAIEIDELKHHEFNTGWNEFKYLVLDYIKSQLKKTLGTVIVLRVIIYF